MHEETSLTVGRVKRVLQERVQPAIYAARQPLEIAAHALDGEPIAPSAGLALTFEPYALGTLWGPAWGTTWFRVTGTIPTEWAGKRVEAHIDLGFDVNMTGFQQEALVYRPDGTPVKSLNPRNQWVPLADVAEGGEEITLFLEAASNPVLLDYHPFLPTEEGDILTSSKEPLYRVRTADLAVFHRALFDLSLDLEVLLELQEQLQPTEPRRMKILQALDNSLDALDLQHLAETAPAAREQLVDVLAAPAHESAHHIAAIGHAHIDSAWLWPVRETIRKVARTTSSMTQLIDETDEFMFGMSSAQQYAWIKEHRPEVYERVKAAVAAGRFLPIGGMWVESDTVMPTGESLARQFLYGQRFFEREFGIRSKGVWLPDSFGYSPALPQLMKRAGFEWFFTQKISWNQRNVFPHHTFLWEGIDGSRMFTHFPPMDTYNAQLSGDEVARAARQFKENRVASRSIAPVGWGDGGGGTTREMVGKQQRLANLEGSATVEWMHPDTFYDLAKAELPNPAVWVGELYLELHRGTLTSQHQTKALHRRAEQALIAAELWAASADVRGDFAYPYDELDRLWEQVLLHEFHDILPGTSIAWVHREAVAVLTDVITRATQIAADATQALAGAGEQALEFAPYSTSEHGLGGALVTSREQEHGSVSATALDGGFVLENTLVRVTVSADGLVTSALDLTTGRETIPVGLAANLLQLHQDFPNMWDAWDIDRYYRNTVTDLTELDALNLLESDAETGAVRIQIVRRFSESTITQVVSLAPGARTVHIRNAIDWRETEKLLKQAFPLAIQATTVEAETQYGYQSRPTHVNTSWEAAKFETSMHRFVLVQERGFGAALVNDGLYGFDTTRDSDDVHGVTTTVRLSLLRAPRFPDPETDHGLHTITTGLVIGADAESATAAGIALNAPVVRVSGAEAAEPLMTATGRGIVISSVKLAADQSGDVIVRVYEALGERTTGSLAVNFPHANVREVSLIEDELADARIGTDLSLTPFEVRTLRISRA